jgi:hypothetical protein
MGAIESVLNVIPIKNRKTEISIMAILINILMICLRVNIPKRPTKRSIIEPRVTMVFITSG